MLELFECICKSISFLHPQATGFFLVVQLTTRVFFPPWDVVGKTKKTFLFLAFQWPTQQLWQSSCSTVCFPRDPHVNTNWKHVLRISHTIYHSCQIMNLAHGFLDFNSSRFFVYMCLQMHGRVCKIYKWMLKAPPIDSQDGLSMVWWVSLCWIWSFWGSRLAPARNTAEFEVVILQFECSRVQVATNNFQQHLCEKEFQNMFSLQVRKISDVFAECIDPLNLPVCWKLECFPNHFLFPGAHGAHGKFANIGCFAGLGATKSKNINPYQLLVFLEPCLRSPGCSFLLTHMQKQSRSKCNLFSQSPNSNQHPFAEDDSRFQMFR